MKSPFKFTRRSMAVAVVSSMVMCFGAASASAEGLTDLKLVAPAGPGGGWDSAARSLQQVLTATGTVKNVQVVNVPGAGGTVGLAQFVNNAKGDGNQLMVMGITMVGAVLTNKAPVGLDAVTPIARMTGDPLVVVVPTNSPLKTMNDLAAAVKADTSKVVWAGGSAGGADHILAGLIAKQAGGDATKLNYVPFSGGGEALAEMLGGRVTAGVSGYNEFESQIKAGKLRALGVSTAKRIEGVNVPTLIEQGLNVEVVNWRGVVAGPSLSAPQKAALVTAVDKALKSAEWAKISKARGWDDAYLDSDGFSAFLKSDQQRVKEVLTTIGLVK